MHDQSKRTFLRQVVFLALFSGISSSKLFALINSEQPSIHFDVDEITRQFYSFQRQVYNHQNLSEMTPSERESQYQALLNILEIVHQPAFMSLSSQEQLATLKQTKPIQPSSNSSKQIQDLWKAMYITGGVGLAIALATRGQMKFLTALTGITLTVPKGLKRIGDALDAGMMIYDGYTIGKNTVSDSILSAAEAINYTLKPEKFSMGEYRFENDIEGLKIQIGSYQNNIMPVPGEEGPNSELTEALISLLMRGGEGSQHIFNNRKQFDSFLQEYIPLIGQIQEDSLKRILAAQQRNDEQRIIEIRDQTAFLSSIQEFIAVSVIEKMAAPKEAKILNTLISTGFEFALSSMTPLGWASVGIKMASILSGSNGTNTFNKAVMTALQNIQKQLNLLLDYVIIINQNQATILKQLSIILDGINEIKDLVGTKFTDLSKQTGLIYDLIEVKDLQDLRGDFEEYNRRIGHAIDNSNSSEIFNFIQNLTGFALQRLQTVTVTQFDNSFHLSSSLKSKIILRKSYRYQISLYDSIGLSSALAGYSLSSTGGFCENDPIVHPVHFYATSDTIINWMLVSNLNKTTQKKIATELLDKAKLSQDLLRSYSDRELIEKFAEQHFKQGLNIIANLRDYMINYLRTNYKGFVLNGRSVLTNFPHYFSYDYMRLPENLNDPIKFYDDNNDAVWITAAKDLGVISSITRLNTKNFRKRSSDERMHGLYMKRPNEVITDFNPFKAAGFKSNRINITNAYIDFQTKKTFSLQYDYSCELLITQVELIKVRDYYVGITDIIAYKEIKKVTGIFNYNENWRQQIRQQLEAQGINPNSYIENFDSPRFNLHTFLMHLVEEQHKAIKHNILQEAKKKILRPPESNYDGLGVTTMYLSKLNNIIVTGESHNFLLDYSKSAYIREDLCTLLDEVEGWDFAKMKSEDANRILDPLDATYDDYAPIYNGREYVDEMSPSYLYTEMLTSLLFKRITETRDIVLNRLGNIENQAGEPYLAKIINKLNAFINLLET